MVSEMDAVVVIGHRGEVGRAVYELCRGAFDHVIGIDIDERDANPAYVIRFAHICIPFGPEFAATVLNYVDCLRPSYVIVHSTVAPGTCDELRRSIELDLCRDVVVAHSPVRGIHPHLKPGICYYTKFFGIAGAQPDDFGSGPATAIAEHLKRMGCREVIRQRDALTCEVGKLLCTTEYAAMIAWHQAADRICSKFGVQYTDAMNEWDDTYYLGRDLKCPRPRFSPGFIGGHCLMPNIEILIKNGGSDPVLNAIKESNDIRGKSK